MKTKLMERIFTAQENQETDVLDQFEGDISFAITNGLFSDDEYSIVSDDKGIDIYDNVNKETTVVTLTDKGFSMSPKFPKAKKHLVNKKFSMKIKRYSDEDEQKDNLEEKSEDDPEEKGKEIDLSFDTKKDLTKLKRLKEGWKYPDIYDTFCMWVDEYANVYYDDHDDEEYNIITFFDDLLHGCSEDEYDNLEIVIKELNKIGNDFVDKFISAFIKFYKEHIIEKKENLTIGGSEVAYFLDKTTKETESKLSKQLTHSKVNNLKAFSKKHQMIIAKWCQKAFSDNYETITDADKREKFIDEINELIDLSSIQMPLIELKKELNSDKFKSNTIWEFFEQFKNTTVNKNFAGYLKWTLSGIEDYKKDYSNGKALFLTNKESLDELDYNIYTLNKVLSNYDKDFINSFFNSYRKWDYDYPIQTYFDLCTLKDNNNMIVNNNNNQ